MRTSNKPKPLTTTTTSQPATARRPEIGRDPMTLGSRARRIRSTRPIGLAKPPITLATTSMSITEIPARETAGASPTEAASTIERRGAADPLRQPSAPVELGAHHVGHGCDQHRERDHRGGHQPDGEQVRRQRTRQRSQRAGGVLCRDYRLVVLAERGCGSDQHEPQDQGGEHGTDDGADPGACQPAAGRSVLRWLLDPACDGLSHVGVAGEGRAKQGEAAYHLVAM